MALATKPRWDKYDGYIGNFRGPLAADVVLATQANRVLAVGVNSSGAVTVGGDQTGVSGVVIIPVGLDMYGESARRWSEYPSWRSVRCWQAW